MARELFVDTSGWYALLDRRSRHHAAARRAIARSVARQDVLVTTDYVIDETATLTRARGGAQAATRFLELIEQTRTMRIEWIDPERFDAVRRLFRKHLDHGYSFTDCASFEVMRKLGIEKALTTDTHFAEAGFATVLDSSV